MLDFPERGAVQDDDLSRNRCLCHAFPRAARCLKRCGMLQRPHAGCSSGCARSSASPSTSSRDGHVHTEAAAQPLPQPVPALNRIARRATPAPVDRPASSGDRPVLAGRRSPAQPIASNAVADPGWTVFGQQPRQQRVHSSTPYLILTRCFGQDFCGAAGSATSRRRPTGQWSLPRTSGRMNAPATRGSTSAATKK